MPALVEADRLAKTYPSPRNLRALLRRGSPPRTALVDVSFDVSAGEVVAIIGPNGAGKSTLLRILAGLLLPSGGHARVDGLDVVADRPRSRLGVGAALSEDRGLSGRLTVRQNLRFFGALYGLHGHLLESRIVELAQRFEADHLLDRAVRTLSTGEKARVVIARTLLHRPKVVLLDEITRSLDPGAARRLRAQIAGQLAERGAAVVLASHDLAEVEALASRVVLLAAGRVEAFGSFAEVRAPAEQVFSTGGRK